MHVASGPVVEGDMRIAFAIVLALVAAVARAETPPVELHDRLAPAIGEEKTVALTLDACGGAYDRDLIALLVARRIPATIFVTRKWLDVNAVGRGELLAHPDLFQLEDHGGQHRPAVVGSARRVYGIPGEPDVAHVAAEVAEGAVAITRLTGRAPRYFRGATALYDAQSIAAIESMGYRIAGFSVNADAGATLPRAAIVARLARVVPGDIVIAHMNRPAGATAEAFAEALPRLEARGFRFVKLGEARLERI